MAQEHMILFGLGAQKAGTSWLHRMLQRHSDVHLPLVKELHYWTAIRPPHFNFPAVIARKEASFNETAWLPQRLRRYQTPSVISRRYVLDYMERWNALLAGDGADHAPYLELMRMGRRRQKVIGDITPAYALLEQESLREMAALGGDVRFVYLMRDPVARLCSGIKHRIRVSGVPADQQQAKADAALREALEEDPHMALRRSNYAQLIGNLDQATDPDKVFYMFYETLFEQESFDRLARFLDIPSLKIQPGRKVNARSPKHITFTPEQMADARAALEETYRFTKDRFGPELPAKWDQS